jgi:hypothetical protein
MGAYCIAFLASPSNCRGGGGGAAILPDLKSTRTSPTPELLRVATRLLARRRIVRVAADIGALERAELALVTVRPDALEKLEANDEADSSDEIAAEVFEFRTVGGGCD